MCLDDRRYSSIKETAMSQMKIADRNRIEFLIALGWPLPKIAADLGRSPSTVRNELLRYVLQYAFARRRQAIRASPVRGYGARF